MSDDEPDSAYGHKQRAFLQAFFSRQQITFQDAQPLIANIENAATPNRATLPEDVTQITFDEYIEQANAALSPFDFEIKSSYRQTGDRERIYALINTTSDALTQMATMHSADEIAFVKRVLDAMFETYNTQRAEVMAITSVQALKLAKAPGDRRDSGAQTQQTQAQSASITQTQAERMLQNMVDEGWFTRSTKGFYSLSQRGIMELRSWLVEMYNDPDLDEDSEEPHMKIKECSACREIITVGQRCPNLPCNTRLHKHCMRNYFRAHGGERCANCKTEWADAPPVGEKAAESTRGGGRGGGRRSTNGTARSAGALQDQSDEVESEAEL